MKRVLLLRHAKSAWPDGVADHDRPLGDRGRRDAPRMGTHIARSGLVPDHALVSSARRTQETWSLLALACKAQTVADIYEAEAPAILAAIRAAPESAGTLLVVGHNPGLETVATLLAPNGDTGALARMAAKYPTSGLATITFDIDRWADLGPGSGRLESFVTPKSLP